MITGDSYIDEIANKMEVLDVSTNVTSVCASSSHKYPLDIYYGTGALVDNKIILCGGYRPHTDLEAGSVEKKRTWNETNTIIKVAHQVTRIHCEKNILTMSF